MILWSQIRQKLLFWAVINKHPLVFQLLQPSSLLTCLHPLTIWVASLHLDMSPADSSPVLGDQFGSPHSWQIWDCWKCDGLLDTPWAPLGHDLLRSIRYATNLRAQMLQHDHSPPEVSDTAKLCLQLSLSSSHGFGYCTLPSGKCRWGPTAWRRPEKAAGQAAHWRDREAQLAVTHCPTRFGVCMVGEAANIAQKHFNLLLDSTKKACRLWLDWDNGTQKEWACGKRQGLCETSCTGIGAQWGTCVPKPMGLQLVK